LHSDHRRSGGKSRRDSEYRRLQSQLHQPAACLQTALLKKRSRDDETLARGFPVMRADHPLLATLALAPQRSAQTR
jgi:hypothetical protein